MSPRSVPCDRCRVVYTTRRVCERCSGSGAEELPPAEDRFADVRDRRHMASMQSEPYRSEALASLAAEEHRVIAAARTVTTPETRRQAPPPVMPAVGRHARATLPTLDAVELAPIDKHVAITKITDAIAAGFYTEERLQQLVDEAERLKLKGRAA